jgi:hypothetical protein
VYAHSLFGTPNDHAAVEESGIARRINRSRFREEDLDAALGDPGSRAARVFSAFAALLRARRRTRRSGRTPRSGSGGPTGVLALERGSTETAASAAF